MPLNLIKKGNTMNNLNDSNDSNNSFFSITNLLSLVLPVAVWGTAAYFGLGYFLPSIATWAFWSALAGITIVLTGLTKLLINKIFSKADSEA